MKLIDKEKVVTEIEKMRDKAYPQSDWNRGYVTSCEKILSFLNTLEVKEVDLDLEITLWANAIPEIRLDDVKRIAEYFYELGIKTQKGE